MTKIPYVCLYRSYEDEFSRCTPQEVGEMVMALLHYLNTGEEVELSGFPYQFWPRLRAQHDRDAEHYEDVCNIRRENGKKGGRPKSKPDGFTVQIVKPKKANEAIENEKENENDKENEKECVCSTHEHTLFIPPSLIDVISFTSSEGLTHMDPQKFVDYYTAVGWVSGGRPIRDWKAMARLWNRRSEKEAPKVVEEVIYGDVL